MLTMFFSFYPIFPVPFDLSSEVNLDISHSDGLRLGADFDEAEEYSPDIVVIPSRLKQFSKVRVVYSNYALLTH